MKRSLLILLLAFLAALPSSHASALAAGAAFTASPAASAAEEASARPARREGRLQRLFGKAADDELLIAVVLALLLPSLGLHRVYLGGKPTLVLVYFLLNFAFGLGVILSIIDAIVMLSDGGVERFRNNDKVFAAFGDAPALAPGNGEI
jgi:TM2 domain-containing membrane protein YozV